jgi:hypothetical protein
MAKFYIPSASGEKVINLTNVQRMLGVYEFITGQGYGICCKSIDLCLIQKLPFDSFTAIVTQLNIWVCVPPPRKSLRSCSIRSCSTATCASSISSASSAWRATPKEIVQNCMSATASEGSCCMIAALKGRIGEWHSGGGRWGRSD